MDPIHFIKTSIPRAIDLKPDLTLLTVGIPIEVFLKGVESTFKVKIDWISNRKNIGEIRRFLLGDNHSSLVNATITTLFVRLFGKKDDWVVHEGTLSSDRTQTRPMVYLNQFPVMLEIQSWDCLPDEAEFYRILVDMQSLGSTSSILTKLVNQETLNQEFLNLLNSIRQYMENFHTRLSLQLQGKHIPNDSKCYDGLIEHLESLKCNNGISQILLKTSLNILLTLKRSKLWTHNSWTSRQMGLREQLLRHHEQNWKSFILAGNSHLISSKGIFEENIQDVMKNHTDGFLSITIDTGETLEAQMMGIQDSFPELKLDENTTVLEVNLEFPLACVLLFQRSFKLFNLAEEYKEKTLDDFTKKC